MTVLLSAQGQLGRPATDGEGAIGDGPNEMGDNLVRVPLPALSIVTAVSCGGSHTCVLLSTGSVYCWGLSTSGQLGMSSTSTPVPLPLW